MASFSSNIDLSALHEFIENAEDAQGVVHYSMPYALYVELPTDYDSKKPPLEPIREWVKRNIQINYDDGESIDSVAYAVQEAIYQNGTEGVFFLSTAFDEFTSGRWEDIAREYEGEDPEEIPEAYCEELLEELLAESQHNLAQASAIDTGALMDSGTYIMDVDPEDFAEDEITVQQVA